MVRGGHRQEATAFLPQLIERIGKRGLDRNSEDPVNEDGEEILSGALSCGKKNKARKSDDARSGSGHHASSV